MTLAHFPGNVIGRMDTVFVLAWVLGLFLACSTLFAPLGGGTRNKWKNVGLAVLLWGSYLLALIPSITVSYTHLQLTLEASVFI